MKHVLFSFVCDWDCAATSLRMVEQDSERGNFVTDCGTIVVINGVDGWVSGGSRRVTVDIVDGPY
eukprot:scaffold84063_cov36-Attheya_sp.AAC.2